MEQRDNHRRTDIRLTEFSETDPSETQSELGQRVAFESAIALSRQVGPGVASNLVTSLVLAIAYWPHVPHSPLLAWVVSLVVICVLRLVWVMWCPPSESMTGEQLRRWLRRFTFSTVVVGCIWGLSTPLFAGQATGVLQYLYLLVLSGMIAGASAAYSAVPLASLAYTAPTCLIASVWLFRMGGDHVWLAGLLILYTLLLSRLVLTTSKLVSNLIQSRLEYRDLAERCEENDKRRESLSGQIRAVTEESVVLAENLHEKDLMLRSVFNQTPIAVMVIDEENNVLQVYGRSATALEEAFGQLSGRSIYQVFSGNSAILQACRDAQSGTEKIAVTRVNNDEYEFIASPYKDREGEQIGMILVGMDVSEEARLRRLQQDFVVHVNHQLRTPLTTILASLEMLTDPKIDLRPETRDELLSSATRSSRRMRDLTETIDRLEAQTEEAGEARIQAKEISHLARKCFQEIGEQDLIHLSVSDKLRRFGYTSVTQRTLAAVLSALIRNAGKYAVFENSTVEVTISDETHQDRDVVLIRVGNQCEPIPEKQQAHLFDKFTVGNNTDRRIHYGLGLGLYTSRHLLAEKGGQIWLERSDAQWTEFCVSLPFSVDAESRVSA